MKFPEKYKVLNKNIIKKDQYSLIPIRYKDRVSIMKWRNEQIYHLRQQTPLTPEKQDQYYKDIVSKLFDTDQPNQILFSFLRNNELIGYGGLVHINWIDKNAEISFIMNTELEDKYFIEIWITYLELIEIVAFRELELHKIYTYAFDIRPQLYQAVESVGFIKEATLKEHCLFEGEYKDVVFHSKIIPTLKVRKAQLNDWDFTFQWANDTLTRENSFSSEAIPLETHKKWWTSKISSESSYYYIFEIKDKEVGVVRFDKNEDNGYDIGITINPEERGKGLSSIILKKGCSVFFEEKETTIKAYIKERNIASIRSFTKAGFTFVDKVIINKENSLLFQISNIK
ncbi:MAG: GNAT family N-acetyltransferase [Chitinophagales bacterium]|nr:GNAT family N-acetyltransferase [Chitinophagales bacterium]